MIHDVMENTVTAQPTALKPSIVKTSVLWQASVKIITLIKVMSVTSGISINKALLSLLLFYL